MADINDLFKKLSEKNQDVELKGASFEYEGATYDFKYKPKMSTADWEYINIDDIGAEDRSKMERTIERMCRDANGEKFGAERIKSFGPDVCLLIVMAMNEELQDKKKTDSKD